MERLISALEKAYGETKRASFKGRRADTPPPLKKALEELERIDFTRAELEAHGPKDVESKTMVGHLMQPTPEGMRLVAAISKLNGALRTHKDLPEEGQQLRDVTTNLLTHMEQSGIFGNIRRK